MPSTWKCGVAIKKRRKSLYSVCLGFRSRSNIYYYVKFLTYAYEVFLKDKLRITLTPKGHGEGHMG